jgi:hypothetical protein
MKKILLVSLVLILLLAAGCSTKYVCYDGSVKDRERDCPIIPMPDIQERTARDAVNNYGQAFARAKGDTFTMVNLYRDGVDWYSNVLFSDFRTQEVNEATLRIDGRTATVSCVEGCAYLGVATEAPAR